MSLDLYCSFIDPAAPDYGVDERTHDREQNKTHAGMQISTGSRAPMENVLVEDCRFRFCGLNTQNYGGVMRNVVFRRNTVIANNLFLHQRSPEVRIRVGRKAGLLYFPHQDALRCRLPALARTTVFPTLTRIGQLRKIIGPWNEVG